MRDLDLTGSGYSEFFLFTKCTVGPGSLSRYSDSLRAGRSGNRIPVGAGFAAPVQTEPGAHPASYRVGSGVKRPGRRVDNPPPPSRAEVKESDELYLFSPSGPSWAVLVRNLSVPLTLPLQMYWIRKFTPVRYCLIYVINRLHVSVVFATIIKVL
jgi:hypothetical protein